MTNPILKTIAVTLSRKITKWFDVSKSAWTSMFFLICLILWNIPNEHSELRNDTLPWRSLRSVWTSPWRSRCPVRTKQDDKSSLLINSSTYKLRKDQHSSGRCPLTKRKAVYEQPGSGALFITSRAGYPLGPGSRETLEGSFCIRLSLNKIVIKVWSWLHLNLWISFLILLISTNKYLILPI